MTSNEIYKQIEAETAACIEREKNFWDFKPRRAYEPECRLQARAKYQGMLNAEMAENEAISDSIQSQLLAGDNTIIITLIIGLAIIFLTYYFIFK